jgi:hypothetical protein
MYVLSTMTRKAGLTALLIAIAVFAGGYFYHTAAAVCKAPIAYRVGQLDPQFGLTEDEARNAISDAESLWEDSTGRNLFTYDPNAAFTINFVYDDRQARTNNEQELSAELDEKKDLSDDVRTQYEHLLATYDDLTDEYESQIDTYNEKLRAHNEEVDRWNTKGGAPQDVYDQLKAEQQELTAEQQQLDALASQLNSIAKQINALGDQGNTLVAAYNSVVAAYNNAFGTESEFTQGDYQGNRIDIYQYASLEELRLVLAHELGHALGLEHDAGTSSIMYYLMGGQHFDDGLSDADKAEFERVCGTDSFTLWPAKW